MTLPWVLITRIVLFSFSLIVQSNKESSTFMNKDKKKRRFGILWCRILYLGPFLLDFTFKTTSGFIIPRWRLIKCLNETINTLNVKSITWIKFLWIFNVYKSLYRVPWIYILRPVWQERELIKQLFLPSV